MAIVALGALMFFALSAKSKPAPAPTPPPLPTGPIVLNGSLSNLTFSAPRMRQQLDKPFGSTILVRAFYVFNATQGGQSITKPWPVRFEVELGHSTTFGWRTSGELGFSETGHRLESITLDSSPLVRRFDQALFSFIMPADTNQTWDLHAKLFATRPDSSGNPSSEFIQLGPTFKADGALRSVAQPLSISGEISNLTFSQIGVGREDILHYLVSSVPRGSNIRNDFPGHSAGFNQSREFVPAFRTGFNPGMGQVGRGHMGRPFRQAFERTDLIRSLQ